MADLIDILEGNSATGGLGKGNGSPQATLGTNEDGVILGLLCLTWAEVVSALLSFWMVCLPHPPLAGQKASKKVVVVW